MPKAPKFSGRLLLSELMQRARQILAAQATQPAHRQAETAACLCLPALLLASACAVGPRHPASPGPPVHRYHERPSHFYWQNDED